MRAFLSFDPRDFTHYIRKTNARNGPLTHAEMNSRAQQEARRILTETEPKLWGDAVGRAHISLKEARELLVTLRNRREELSEAEDAQIRSDYGLPAAVRS